VKRLQAHYGSTGQLAAAFPGFLTLFLPKCPLCWAGILALLGIHSALAVALLYPIGFFCLVPAAGLMAIKARRHGGWGPFSLYSIAGVMLISGRLFFQNEYMTGVGALTMLAAIVWSVLPQAAARKCACRRGLESPHIPRIQAARHPQVAGSLHYRAAVAKDRQFIASDR
jgi:hypothetical protein